VTVIHFVELVLWLEVAQLGISQHGRVRFPLKNTMLKKPHKSSKKFFKNNVLSKFNTMNTPSEAAWYRVPNMASGSNRTIYHAIETGCLAMRKFARQCYAKNEKSPQLRGLIGVLMLFD